MSDPHPFELIVHRGGERIPFRFESDAVIGRSRECDLPLPDRLVSRTHCRVRARNGSHVLVDAGASNKAKLRGVPVDEAELRDGDVFVVGATEIEFHALEAEVVSFDETMMPEQRRHTEDLETFIEIARALNGEPDLSRLLTRIVDAAIQLTGAERGFLILGQGEESTVEVARNFAREEVNSPEFAISRGIAQRVRESGVPEQSTDAQADDRFRDMASVSDLRLRSVLCIPLRIRGEVEGVLYVDNRLQEQVFSDRELKLLLSLADHAGLALHNARQVRELRSKQSELEVALDRVAQLNGALEGRVKVQAAQIDDMRQELDATAPSGRFRHDYRSIVGQSRRMADVFRLLDKFIPAEDPVLVLGESGTGKELVARAIHRLGPRSKGAFVSENCAALPEALLESELFGYAKGAFTGAQAARKGLLVSASGGVLFLDEIGEMDTDLQKKLLRVLQEGEVRPLGSTQTVKVDVRLVTATNRNLEDMVREGEFREDLYYRLNVLPVQLPPLRERREDIPALVDRFLGEMQREGSLPSRARVSPEAMEAMVAHRWPGNVRELQNEIRRAAILAEGVISPEHLSESVRSPRRSSGLEDDGLVPAERGTTLPDMVRELEVREIEKAMQQSNGNKSRTAEMLGISRFALQRKLEKFDLAEGGNGGADDGERSGSEET
ncbi:MAG: sigma 54-interacting transcriptional regulator [Planctomycetota bacterium]